MPEENKEVREEVPALEDATEEYSFDELAKGLASGVLSRGQVLKLVGASILGGLLPSFLVADIAEAKHQRRKKNKKKCPAGFTRVASPKKHKHGKRRKVLCVQSTTSTTPGGVGAACTTDAQCTAPAHCVDGICTISCDAAHPCPAPATCVNGICVSSLPICPIKVVSGCALGPPTCQCPVGTTCIGSGTSGKCK